MKTKETVLIPIIEDLKQRNKQIQENESIEIVYFELGIKIINY